MEKQLRYEVNKIGYRYTENAPQVLKSISFSMEEGEIACLVGPSGSGKSTLGLVLSGVIPKLLTGGVLAGDFTFGDDVAVVSQSPENQLFGYGVEDAIAFGVENMGLDYEQITERIEYVMELFNIEYLRGRSVATLSGGQRQVVCIASVLAMQPKVLIMDEPVSSLDPRGKAMVRQILDQLAASGQTTLIIDNNLDWCDEIIDHVVGLRDGTVCFDGSRDAFYNDFEIQRQLGVVIPQEVELFCALRPHFPDIPMFFTLEGAAAELTGLLPEAEATPSVSLGEMKRDAVLAADKGDTVLAADKVTKVFADSFHALIDVDAGFAEGCVVAILGQNGSGKTTLVKHLNGLHRPTSGVVRYQGVDLCGRSVAQISRDVILVFQHPEHMLFEESVLAELTFCARMQGIPFTQEEAMSILNEYGFGDDSDEMPINLSMGKKHILTILSVLFSEAKVVVLDEPTLGMDRFLKEKLLDIIRRLVAQGRTVIMISHEIPMTFGIADDVLVLNEGRVIYEGSKKRLVDRKDIFDAVRLTPPPVVELASRFGFPSDVFTVEDFVRELLRLREDGRTK